LKSIDVDPSNSNYASDDGVLYDKDKQTLIRFPGGKGGNFTIPDGVRTLEDDAFYGCTYLENVFLSHTVQSVGSYPFGGCTNLQSINVGGANENFKSLDGVLLRSDGYRLELLKFPNGRGGDFVITDVVGKINEFAFDGCTNLESLTIATDAVITGHAFAGCKNLKTFHVSDGDWSYKAVDGVLFDSQLFTLIRFPPKRGGEYIVPKEVRLIGESAFEGSENLEYVIVPPDVSTIKA